MIPKAGDLVRLNPAGCNENMKYETYVWEGTRRVEKIVPYKNDPDYLSIYLNEGGSFGIKLPEGRHYTNPKDSAPFFLIEGTEAEPRNNDGRAVCYWCPDTKTQKRGGGMYDVCPKCGK